VFLFQFSHVSIGADERDQRVSSRRHGWWSGHQDIDSMESQVMSTPAELRASAEAKFKKKELQRV
jgi:hypothetical protein